MDQTDPFRHHPSLRGLITPPEHSYFRDLDLAALDRMAAARGHGPDWRLSDATREAGRAEVLSRRPPGDLWVFAYGSLMWDPAVMFSEVRRAHLHGRARRFCLYDVLGGRGTPEAPGLMAALLDGPGCEGLAFRIPAARIADETERLWRREMIAPCYRAEFLPAALGEARATVLAFVGDPGTDLIHPDLSRAQQVRCLATGHGDIGSSFEYIDNLVAHLDALDIPDPDTRALHAAARALRPPIAPSREASA